MSKTIFLLLASFLFFSFLPFIFFSFLFSSLLFFSSRLVSSPLLSSPLLSSHPVLSLLLSFSILFSFLFPPLLYVLLRQSVEGPATIDPLTGEEKPSASEQSVAKMITRPFSSSDNMPQQKQKRNKRNLTFINVRVYFLLSTPFLSYPPFFLHFFFMCTLLTHTYSLSHTQSISRWIHMRMLPSTTPWVRTDRRLVWWPQQWLNEYVVVRTLLIAQDLTELYTL